MVPELPIAMLACARIGAVHTVIFSGFSAASIKDRIDDSKSKIVITADGGFRRGKIVKLKEVIDDAIKDFEFVKNVIVLERTKNEIIISPKDKLWNDLMETASDSCDAEKLDSNHPLYILYTSGTTGKQKVFYMKLVDILLIYILHFNGHLTLKTLMYFFALLILVG